MRPPARPLLTALLALAPLRAAAPPDALPRATIAELRAVLGDAALAQGFAGALVIAAGRRSPEAVAAGIMSVVPYDGGRRPVLFDYQADKLLIPASSLKLFTAAAALDALGPARRFVTRVVATPPRDGTVDSLTLVGGGDPSLTTADLKELAAAVRDAGLRQVGSVRGDGSRYADRYGYGWTVDDLPWYYAAEVSALSLDRNQVDVFVAPGAPGGPARVWCEPSADDLRLESSVVTGPAHGRSQVVFDRAPDQRTFVLRGSIAADEGASLTEGMAIKDIELHAAYVFRRCLREAGVAVSGSAVAGPAPDGTVELARRLSPPLSDLLHRTLKNSDNLYAELLLRELGVQTAGSGTAAGGLHGVRAFLQRYGIEAAGLRIEDGSGLSRYNLVTPRALAGVLRAMAFHRYRETFYAAMSIAGVDGTLAWRMRGTPAAGAVRAKTGFLTNQTSLSGYVTTGAGDFLIVCTIFNHSPSPARDLRRLHDRFFTALAQIGD